MRICIREKREKRTGGDENVISAHVKEDVQRKRKSQRAKGHRMTTCVYFGERKEEKEKGERDRNERRSGGDNGC